MNDYRFDISEHDGTITRARLYPLPGSWTSDSWSRYWDSDGQVGFFDEGWRGLRGLDPEPGFHDEDRAMRAYKAERDYGQTGALDRVAQRLTGNREARFICVGLDRGIDFHVLMWDASDPERVREWQDEIEAVYHGDIWRIECEEYQPGFGVGGGDWVPSDDYPDEFYGDAKAESEFARVFSLTEFPAEMLVGSDS